MKNILITVCLFFIALTNTHADEWKKCESVNSTVNDREIAIEFGKRKKSIAFLKKSNFAHITIFVDDKTWVETDLIPTGQRLYGDGRPYLGYADKSNTVIVQEFINGKTMIVGIDSDKLSIGLYASCD